MSLTFICFIINILNLLRVHKEHSLIYDRTIQLFCMKIRGYVQKSMSTVSL